MINMIIFLRKHNIIKGFPNKRYHIVPNHKQPMKDSHTFVKMLKTLKIPTIEKEK